MANLSSKKQNNKLHRVIWAENLALFYCCGVFYGLEQSCVLQMDFNRTSIYWSDEIVCVCAQLCWMFYTVYIQILCIYHYFPVTFGQESHCTLLLICWMRSDFFTWPKYWYAPCSINATCTVLSANTCHSITLLGSQVVWSILMFIFYVDLKLASSLMTCCLWSIVESKLNPSISI